MGWLVIKVADSDFQKTLAALAPARREQQSIAPRIKARKEDLVVLAYK